MVYLVPTIEKCYVHEIKFKKILPERSSRLTHLTPGRAFSITVAPPAPKALLNRSFYDKGVKLMQSFSLSEYMDPIVLLCMVRILTFCMNAYTDAIRARGQRNEDICRYRI
jgi:hypothetical protein